MIRRLITVSVLVALLLSLAPISPSASRSHPSRAQTNVDQRSWLAGLQSYAAFGNWLISKLPDRARRSPEMSVAPPVTAYFNPAPFFVDAPTNLTVTSTSDTQVVLSWTAPAGAVDHYQVERSQSISGPFVFRANATGTSYPDAATTDQAYLYRVRAVTAAGAVSLPSNMALGTATSFEFSSLQGQLIKAQHFYDVRTAVNAVRAVANLPAATWSPRQSLNGAIVEANDVQEMRNKLDEALNALSIPVTAYTDPTLSTGANGTLIRAIHIEQLQTRSTRGSSNSAGPLDSDSSTARLDPMNETGGSGENPLSRNFNWNLPLVSLPGRAGLDLDLTLSYNSLVWTKAGNTISFNKDSGFPAPGFRVGFPVIQQSYYNAEAGTDAFLLIGSDGSRTELRQVTGSTTLYEAVDSSHLLFDSSSMILRGTDGAQFSYSAQGGEFKCTEVKDRNGNYISVSYTQAGQINTVTDTLGRVITFEYTSGLLTAIKQTWNQNPPTHYWARFEYNTNTPIDIDFGSLTLLGAADNSSITTLTKVTLADNSHFDFSYTSWGQVWKVSQYAADNHLLNYRSYNLPTTATPQHSDCPRFTQRRDWAQNWNGDTDGTPVAGEEALTQFEVPVSDTWTMPGASTTVSGMRAQITAPDNTSNKIYFIGGAGTATGWQRSLPALVNTYDSGGVLQRQVMTTWTQDNTNVSYQLNPRITETNTYDPAGNRARKEFTYQQFTFANGTNCYLPRDVYEYAANATTRLRSTRTDYNNSTSYTDRRILGLVSEKQLYEGDVNNGGVLKSKVGFFYDNENGASSIQGTDLPVQHDNTNYTANFVTGRANLSTVKRYDVTNTAQSTTTSMKYNTAGAVVSSKDAANHETTTSYADAFSDGITTHNTLAYATKVTDPDNYYRTFVYNFDFGAITKSKTPPPNETGTQSPTAGPERTITYDDLGRIERTTNLVNNAYTRFEYPTSQIRVDAYSTIQDSLGEAHLFQISDGAGRVIATASDHNLNTFSGQRIVYDVMGRVIKTSNPTETTASGQPSQWNTTGDDNGAGWIYTQQTYDWKGRPLVTTNQDLTTKTASYSGCGCAGGEVVTLTDEGSIDGGVVKKRQQKIYSDVLGRVVKTEILNWEAGTVYSATVNTYDVRDQITLIREYAGAEGSGTYQDTTMGYDGYGRLQSHHRPEQDNGTSTVWTYNADDTVSSVADARGAATSYTYNGRHLVTNISYTAPTPIPTPGPVTYTYDAAGNRMSMLDGSGSNSYQYDQLSRMSSESRLINGLSGNQTIGYTYTLSGGLKSLTDPEGRIVNYDYDKRGRLTGVTGTGYNTSQFISNYQYRAWGAPKHFNSSSVVFESVTASHSIDYSYNSRLQLTHFQWVQTNSTGAVIDNYKSDYQFYADGRIKFISDARVSSGVEYTHNFDRGYRYDHAGRLTTGLTGDEARGGTTVDGPYKETYQYDVWNHMNSRVNRIWSKPVNNWTGTYVNNRNTEFPWEYDADGNAKRDENGTATFDAAGRKVGYPSMRYYHAGGAGGANPNETWNQSVVANVYDGDGQMVKQVETSGTSQWTAYFVRSTVLDGALIFWKEVQTFSLDPTWSSTLRFSPIYAGGERIAQSMDGNVTFEYEEPYTGRRRGVEPDPLGQPVGTSDPGPDEPADPGGYPEPHDFGNVEDPGSGCTMDGIGIDCGTAMRFVNSGSAYQCQNNNCSRRWAQVEVKYYGDDGVLRTASGGGWIGPNDIPDGTHTFTGSAAKEAYRAFKWADAVGFAGRVKASYFFGVIASLLGDGAVSRYSFQDPQDPLAPLTPKKDFSVQKMIEDAKEQKRRKKQAWDDFEDCVKKSPGGIEYARIMSNVRLSSPLMNVGIFSGRVAANKLLFGINIISRANLITLVGSVASWGFFMNAEYQYVEPRAREKYLAPAQRTCMDQVRQKYGFTPTPPWLPQSR